MPGTGGSIKPPPVTGECPPTGVFSEDANVDDMLVVGLATPEDAQVSDDLRVGVTVMDDVGVGDEVSLNLETVTAENASVDDLLAVRVATPEDAQVTDDLRVGLITPEDAQVWDDLVLRLSTPDDANVNDALRLRLEDVDVARTGTPDLDPMFDAYVAQNTANTNFGNANLVVKGASTTPGNDARRAYLAYDLTGLSGFSGWDVLPGPSSLRIILTISNSNALLAGSLGWSARNHTAKPFTESTVTWNAPPLAPTSLIAGGTLSIAPGGGFASYVISIPASQMNAANAWGRWFYVEFTGTGGLAPDTFTIVSRDSATAANRPRISYACQRG